MNTFQILAPLLGLIGIGAGLRSIHFLGPPFIRELNKLAFWVALPSVVFRSAVNAGPPGSGMVVLFGVLLAATVGVLLLGLAAASAFRLRDGRKRTFVAVTFFGNVAYIGIPVLAHSLGDDATGATPALLSVSVILMTALVVVNNALAAVTFESGFRDVGSFLRHVLLNPLVVSGVAGVGLAAAGVTLPVVVDDILRDLGRIAIPIALLCIGGALEWKPLAVQWPEIAVATVLKLIAFPAFALGLGHLAGLSPDDLRIVLVFAACPTATVAYTMASQMNGDESLAAGTIATTSLATFASLAVVLALTGG